MSLAARSVDVTMVNFTSNDLERDSVSMEHGIVTPDHPPPEKIEAEDSKAFRVESQGMMTGVEGTIKYNIGDGSAKVVIYVDNPYVGSNSYNVYTEGSSKDKYTCDRTGGDGDNASISVKLKEKK
ncbi:hypothetical protein CNMCM8980_006751 [Aspergillus fumigatiaffinis]|nr:hypothetical protein CNMCM8980_006751 [Aspergillus fumigatiaffinis]